MPIIGITASSNQTTKLTNYFSIATTTLGTSAASVTFSSIPQTFTHLQVRYFARATVNDNTYIRFNGDTGANYSTHFMLGNGSAVSSGAVPNSTSIYTDVLTGSASSFSAGVVDILDYKNTTKFKTVKTFSGINVNGAATSYIWLASGNWRNTNAITSLTLNQSNTPYVFVAGSTFALYGVI